MKKHLTKNCVLLLAVLIACSFFGTNSTPVSGQTTDQDKAMAFMENVLPIDLSKYTLTLLNDFTQGEEHFTNGREIHNLRYGLTSTNSGLQISFTFEHGAMSACNLYVLSGQVITNSQSNNLRQTATDILKRYQTQTHIDSSNLITMLNNADITKNSTTITENTKFTIKNMYYGPTYVTSFIWTNVINGADYTSIDLDFYDDGSFSLLDNRLVYTIGDTSINVSLEQAVDIAIENLGSYSYAMPDGSIVKDFEVNRDAIMVELVVAALDSAYELRPYYDIRMYLDEVYPGNVLGITAFVRADTGEVIAYSNMATGGTYNTDNINYSDAGSSFYNMLMVVVVVVVMVVVLAFGILFKKRYK